MKLYNTATRQKEEFNPINEKKVGIYSCGPTVYSSPHIGNMYSYVCWDVLVRTLNYLGYGTDWVMNITDVGHLTSDADSGEDKFVKQSKKLYIECKKCKEYILLGGATEIPKFLNCVINCSNCGFETTFNTEDVKHIKNLTVWEIAKKYEVEFMENLKALNINVPNEMPRATENIQEQIDLIKKIEANGFTYKTSDGIYYDTSKFVDYGKFANLNLEKIKEGARVEVNEEKKNPTDFALWKFSPTDEKRQMEWESPWGMGFPGWHIECTAMSTKILGETFDIHTGGEDHIPVHHTNEIAQAMAAFGHNTANYWMHNAFITFKGSKISKSSGGLYTVKDLMDLGYDPMVFRYMVLSSNYRKGIEFSLDSLKVAEINLNKLRSYRVEENGIVNEEIKKEFVEKISDDLSMPEALAIVWKVAKSDLDSNNKWATLLDFDKVLGLKLDEEVKEEAIPEEIIKLAQEREKARQNKDWGESDRLRGVIKDKGYLVEDLKDQCKIRKLK